jgi:hypothetical protein
LIPNLPTLPISITEVEQILKRLDDWLFKCTWDEAVRAQAQAKQDPVTYEFLARLYRNHPMLTVNGVAFPTIVMCAPESQWDNPESVLIQPLGAETYDCDSLRTKGARYLETLERLSKIIVRAEDGREHRLLRFYDGTGYRMLAMKTSGILQLECCRGWYYDQISTCDSLRWELLTAIGRMTSEEKEKLLLQRFPLRAMAHSIANDPIVDGHGRSANIGISTLVVFNDGEGYSTFVRERSKQVAVYRDDLHVIPSFMFEPEAGDVKNEYSVGHNVFREYLEELFNKRELESPPATAAFDWFYDRYPDLQFLFRLLDNRDEAELLFTGLAVDLFSLRPEILTLLLIKSPEWWENHKGGNRGKQLSHIEVNYEFKTQRELSQERRDIIVKVKLNSALLPQTTEAWSTYLADRSRWVPPGAAAFYLGLEVARKKLGIL